MPYEIVKYQRMEGIPLAPPELRQVHPLGKSPVVTDGGRTIAESGAIVEYVVDTYGKGRLKPPPGTDAYWKYVEWMHYAEGSAMFPLLMALMAGFMGDGAAIIRPRIDSEIANHLSYIERGLEGREYFVGNNLTGADIQMLFVFEAAGRKAAFSGDTRYCRALIEASRRADVLVHECFIHREMKLAPGRTAKGLENVASYHTLSGEVGKVAAAAEVKCLMLNHFVPVRFDKPGLLAEVAQDFAGPVLVGEDLMSFDCETRAVDYAGAFMRC